MGPDSTDPARGQRLPEPPWWTPRKQQSRRSLSRETIVHAALDVLRSEGIDGVSMRRVATALGTGPASLYAHVAHKEELLELLFDEVAGEVELPEPDPRRWREQVTRIWLDSHAAFTRYRDIARVALGGVPVGPNALRITETTMTLLRLGGVPEQAVAWSVDVVGLYVAASAIEGAIVGKEGEGGEEREPRLEQVAAHFAALPEDRLPTLRALLPHLASGDREERFRFGLELLVGGLAALAGRP